MEGGDHGLAAAGAVPCQDVGTSGGGGELVNRTDMAAASSVPRVRARFICG